MSYSYAGDVSEHSYYSPSAAERTPVRGRNGSCTSRPSTSRLPFNSNFIPSSGEKRRIILPQFVRNRPNSVDNRIGAFQPSNSAAISGSSIQFVPAKRPFETDSKELKAKYICITGKNSGPFASVSGQNGGIRAYPTSNGTPKLLNGNCASAPSVDAGTSAAIVNSGVPPPQFDIFPADGVRLQWDPDLRCSTGVGLNNLGNTCFLNSVLQVLTNTAPLANYLLGEGHDSQKCVLSACALCVMKTHICRIFSCAGNGHETTSPSAVVSRIRSFMKSHSIGRQEDAHEFLRYFIDAMQSAALFPFKDQKLDLFTKETSVISRIFGGYHKNEIVCNSCHSSSVTYDPFMDLNVEIKQSSSLETALSHFTCVEILSSDNAYQCPKCSRRVSAKKIFTIFQAPNILTIQLKRFDHFGKIDRQITYPERLNLRPYMTEKQGPSVNYKLYGVIVHVGRTTHSGHYYAFVRNPCDQWHVMDDSRVTPVPAQNALRIAGAYVLFYMRMPTPVASVKPQAKTDLGFIGPQLPPTTPSPIEEKPADTIPQPRFKATFSEIRATSVSSTLGSLPSALPNGPTRPLTPIVSRQASLINSAIRVQQPLKFRLTSNRNGSVPNQSQGPGSAIGLQSKPPPARQIILKIKPIQDSSVSSSTKLVPYDEDEEEDEKCEEATTARTLPNGASADLVKPEVATGTDAGDSKVESTASPNSGSESGKSPPVVSSTSISEPMPLETEPSPKRRKI